MTGTSAGATSDGSLPSGVRLLAVSTISGTLESFITPYARHFRALGWQVDAAANDAPANPVVVAAFDHVYDLPLSRSLFDLRGLIRGRKAIRDVIEEARPDIVHVHTPIAGFVTRLAVRQIPRERRPAVVYTAHGFHFFKGGSRLTNAAFATAERIAGRWTDRLIVINEEDFEAAGRLHIVAPRKLLLTRGIGVDTEFYDPSHAAPEEVAAVRAELGIPEGTPMFLVPGELNRNKRQRDVVSALARMRHVEAHLVLAGYAGSEADSVAALIESLGIRDRVHVAGFVRNFRPLMRGANAVVLASSREGLARSIMEASSLEVPVIASTARGNRELLDGESGILFAIGDVAALAEAMDRVLDNPEAAAAMARRGRARMVETFDIRPVLRQHEELYAGLLAERVSRT